MRFLTLMLNDSARRIGETPLAPVESLPAIERNFHGVIRKRISKFKGVVTLALPKLEHPLPTADCPDWFPVPGMYGGFSYWVERNGATTTLIVESWSRVVGGSAQRHAITSRSALLLDKGFDMW